MTRTCVHCSRTLPTHQLRPKRLFGRLDGNWECRNTRECLRATLGGRGGSAMTARRLSSVRPRALTEIEQALVDAAAMGWYLFDEIRPPDPAWLHPDYTRAELLAAFHGLVRGGQA